MNLIRIPWRVSNPMEMGDVNVDGADYWEGPYICYCTDHGEDLLTTYQLYVHLLDHLIKGDKRVRRADMNELRKECYREGKERKWDEYRI